MVRKNVGRARRARLGGGVLPIAGLLILAACSQANDARENEASAASAIVSNRPQTDKNFVAIVRLSRDPLLRGPRDATDHVTVAPGAKKALLAEQQRFLDALKALSPDIRVLYTYRLTFNGFAIVGPASLRDKFQRLPGVVSIEEEQTFERPAPAVASADATTPSPFDANSVKFIGGEAAHAAGITGKGVRVGVIDTGIDYTHAMFGGAGTPDAYAKNDPTTIEPGTFPTAKVVGGIDLVGTAYDASSVIEDTRLPKPDADPLDEAGHGSHVSGTIAGHGDGVNTYDGMAPDATLYAIKIFGKSGSTGDSVIMAALEYAADPDGDLDPKDRLDVVNLSLGGGFGTRYALYDEVIKNLSWGGTATVCAAGNSGPTPYVVGAPSTAADAISVAASVDDSAWNWRFSAVSFATPDQGDLLVRAYEGTFSKPIAQSQGVSGKLVPAGLAATDFPAAVAAAIKGNVALIDRGVNPFYDKVSRAYAAGAIGVVIANNKPGDPIAMSGSGPMIPIPAVMITQDLGNQFKADVAASKDVTIAFYTDKRIETPNLVDSLASFSSRGPRSLDGLIKPELAAPGYQVVSASMGSGSLGVKLSGTSMATPHITGTVALLRQANPVATPQEIKERMMETGSPVHDASTLAAEPVSLEGAGRVHVMDAMSTPLLVEPPSLSLGFLGATEATSVTRMIWLRNTGSEWLRATITADAKPGLTVDVPKGDVWVPPHGAMPAWVRFTVDLSQAPPAFVTELDDLVHVTASGARDDRPRASLVVPVLAEARRGAEVAVDSADVSDGTIALSFGNPGAQAGEAVPFNLVGLQSRDAAKRVGPCSLASAGYRVNGTQLEIGVRVKRPLSWWDLCEVSVLVDANGDGVPEQELSGSNESSLKPPTWSDSYGSFLIDAAKMRDVESKMEQGTATGADTYLSAVQDVKPFTRFGFAQIGVVAADLTKLQTGSDGKLHVKIGLLPSVEGTVDDDFLGASPGGDWLVIDPKSAPFGALPSSVAVAAAGSATLSVMPATSVSSALLVYMPDNDPSVGTSLLVLPNGASFVVR